VCPSFLGYNVFIETWETPMTNTFFNLGREATKWCCDNLASDDPAWDFKWETKYGELIVQEVIDILSVYRMKVIFLDGIEHNCQHPITVIQNHFEV